MPNKRHIRNYIYLVAVLRVFEDFIHNYILSFYRNKPSWIQERIFAVYLDYNWMYCNDFVWFSISAAMQLNRWLTAPKGLRYNDVLCHNVGNDDMSNIFIFYLLVVSNIVSNHQKKYRITTTAILVIKLCCR